MTEKNIPYLCGGIFFVLLLQARKPRIKVRNNFKSGTDGLKDVDVMKGLIKVVTSSNKYAYDNSFSKNTSEYKSCKYSGGSYIPFNNTVVVTGFDNDVKNKNSDTLHRMSEFIDIYIDVEKAEWLVKALLNVIEMDTFIKDTDIFYIRSNGQAISKAEIFSLSNIDFQPFLLGILHYIIMNRPDNKLGSATYEAWHTQPSPHTEWQFTSNIGSGITRPLNIVIPDPFSETDVSDAEEIPEVDVQDSDSANNESAKVINQYISNPTIVNQNGEKNIHIDHVDTLNI